jgi:hypothetical protein
MIGRHAALLTLAAAIATSCKAAPPPAAPPPPQQLVLLNKVWRVTAPAGKPLGSMYLFLPDGTLLMTSCVETYRLAKWSANADGTLTITEDAATTYRATYQIRGPSICAWPRRRLCVRICEGRGGVCN